MKIQVFSVLYVYNSTNAISLNFEKLEFGKFKENSSFFSPASPTLSAAAPLLDPSPCLVARRGELADRGWRGGDGDGRGMRVATWVGVLEAVVVAVVVMVGSVGSVGVNGV